MLDDKDVTILFLKHLGRRYTSTEWLSIMSMDNLNVVKNYILNLVEYKKKEYIYYGIEYVHDDTGILLNDVWIENDKYDGVCIGNMRINFETTPLYNQMKNCIDYKGNILFDVSNIVFNNYEYIRRDQFLSYENASFTDTLYISDTQIIKVEKQCLHTYTNCLLQTISTTSENVVELHHKMIYDTGIDVRFLTYIFNNQTIYISEIWNNKVICINAYIAPSSTYNGYNKMNNVYNNMFELNNNETFYILSYFDEYKDNDKYYHRNKVIDICKRTVAKCREESDLVWKKRWSTNIVIENKLQITQKDRINTKKFKDQMRLSLYYMYTKIASANLYTNAILPVLDINGGMFLIEQMWNKSSESIIENAYTVFFTWNVFRISKDIHWLIHRGIDHMINKSKSICAQMYDNNNQLVLPISNYEIYFANLALQSVVNAIYELNYLDNANFEFYLKLSETALNKTTYCKIVTPPSSIINVYVENIDGVNCYVFYDEDNNRLGYEFGGTSGFQFALEIDTMYTFKFDQSLIDFPIHFKDMNDQIINHDQSEITVSSNFVKSYESKLKGSIQGILIDKFNYNYGKDAFVVLPPLSNIIDDERFDMLVLLMTYFNKYIRLDLSNDEYYDILNDNVLFYRHTKYKQSVKDNVIISGMYALLAQYERDYEKKRNWIGMFYDMFLKDDVELPWKIPYYDLRVFIILTTLGGIYVDGYMNSIRHTVRIYGIYQDNRQIMPLSWKNFSVQNIHNKTYNYNNILYNDDPLNLFLETMNIQIEYFELENYVNVIFDLSTASRHEDGDFSFYIQTVHDTNEYTSDNIDTVTTTNPVQSIHYERAQLKFDEDQIIPSLSNINLYIVYKDESANEFFKKTLEVVQCNYCLMINPTIHYLIEYVYDTILEQKMRLKLWYNSQDHFQYKCVKQVVLTLTYNSEILYDPIFVQNSNDLIISSDVEMIDHTIIWDWEINNVSYDYIELGEIEFTMNIIENMEFPLEGEVKSVMNDDREYMRQLRLINEEVYPPPNYKLKELTGHKIEYESINPLSLNSKYYMSIGKVYSSGNNNFQQIGQDIELNLREFELSTEINSFLETNNFHIVRIIPAVYHVFLLVNTETDTVLKSKYYAIGDNRNNKLGIDTTEIEINNITECSQINNISDDLFELRTTNMFTIIFNQTIAYGVGENTSYQLCISHNNDINILEECTEITSLLNRTNSEIIDIIVNDKCLLIYCTNEKVYVIGSNPIFTYITNLDVPNCTILTEAVLINEFLETGYKIVSIEGGSNHFKFKLLNLETYETEWWAIGQNRLNSLGINPNIQNDEHIRIMTRVHQLEELIHGTNYNDNYNGISIFNSTEYILISNNGIPTFHNIVYDKIRKEFYILGSMNVVDVYNEWTKIEYNIIETPTYFILNNFGIFIGVNNGTLNEYKDPKYYLRVKSSANLSIFDDIIYMVKESTVDIFFSFEYNKIYKFMLYNESVIEILFGSLRLNIDANDIRYYKVIFSINTIEVYDDRLCENKIATHECEEIEDNGIRINRTGDGRIRFGKIMIM